MSWRVLAILGRAYLGLILFFLCAPILVMATMSFNASEFYRLPFRFSTEWYQRLAQNHGDIAGKLEVSLDCGRGYGDCDHTWHHGLHRAFSA